MRNVEFDDDLLVRIHAAVKPGDEMLTLANRKPNVITGIDREGIWVQTQRSASLGTGPQLVPAWMIVTAWEHLRKEGPLSQAKLLHGLNVKRSAFVLALLARFKDIGTRSEKPAVIELVARAERSSITT